MIADKVFSLESFKRQYKSIIAISVSITIKNLKWKVDFDELNGQINWNNILGIASILSHSESTKHLEAALRIAQTCLNLNLEESQKKLQL